MPRALQSWVFALRGKSEPALDGAAGRPWTLGLGPRQRAGARDPQILRQVRDEHFRNRLPVLRHYQALKCQRMALARAIGAHVAVGADPAFLKSFFDLVRARRRVGDGAGRQHAKICSVMTARMGLWVDHLL